MPGQTAFLERQVPVRFDGSLLLNSQYCLDGLAGALRHLGVLYAPPGPPRRKISPRHDYCPPSLHTIAGEGAFLCRNGFCS